MDDTVNAPFHGRLKGSAKAGEKVRPAASPLDARSEGQIEPEMSIGKKKDSYYSQLSTLDSSTSVSVLLSPSLSSILRQLPERRFNSAVRMLKRS